MTAVAAVGVSVALIAPAVASPSPAPSPAPSATLQTGLGVAGTIPDYNINPLRLARLKVQLAHAVAEMKATEAAYRASMQRVAAAQAAVDALQEQAEHARSDADAKRAVLDAFAKQAYMTGASSGLNSSAVALLNTDSPGDLLSGIGYLRHIGDEHGAAVNQAVTAINRADTLTFQADRRLAAVDREAAGLRAQFTARRDRVWRLTGEINHQISVVTKAVAAAQATERVRAADAVNQWTTYLSRLAAAQVSPPPAATLVDPAHLPAGMSPVRDQHGAPERGVAEVSTGEGPLLVLPREVIAAIGSALTKLGLPYVWGGVGPVGYDCSGLTMTAYADGGLLIPRTSQVQWTFTANSRVAPGHEMPGDLIFFVGAGDGGTPDAPDHVGMVLDPQVHLFIQAPHTGDVVKVSPYAYTEVLGFGRVTTAPLTPVVAAAPVGSGVPVTPGRTG